MKRYLLVWSAATMALLVLVAAANVLVDPYGILRLVDRPGFNHTKPSIVDQGPMAKAYQVARVQPRGLILGNSRAEVGLDPEHSAWPASARPVYNLALPGTGTAVTLRYLKHALASADRDTDKPRLVLWSVDFLDFLNDPAAARHAADPAPADRRLRDVSGVGQAGRLWQRSVDLAESTLTLAALLSSAQTVANQGNPFAIHRTPLGFNPMRDYAKISADEGYWALFQQKDQANLKSLMRQPKGIFDNSGHSSRQFEDLKAVLALCRQHGIALHLFSPPYHAHFLETFRITGHAHAFEQWKRALVKVLDDEAMASRAQPYPFWDFSVFNAWTTEPIPPKGDRYTAMQWYWEGGHFKRALGDQILLTMLGTDVPLPGFGVLLGPANVDAHLAADRVAAAAYRDSHQPELQVLADLARQFGSRR